MFNVVGNKTDVDIQDKTSETMIVNMSNIIAETTLSVLGVLSENTITVTSPTGILVGQYITLYSVPDNRVYFGNITDVTGSVLTLDSPLDFAFPIGTFVSTGSINMNVNGSVTTQIFGVRNSTSEAVPLVLDITRIIITCITAEVNDLSTFGDIVGGLANGIVVRTINGSYKNIFNARDNLDLANLMYDFDILVATSKEGDNGFKGRMTFSGQEKFGVVVRLNPGEDLQLLVQDNLTTLTRLNVLVEGRVVD